MAYYVDTTLLLKKKITLIENRSSNEKNQEAILIRNAEES